MTIKNLLIIWTLTLCGPAFSAPQTPVSQKQIENLTVVFGDRKRVLQSIKKLEESISWAQFQLQIMDRVSPDTILSLIRSVPQVPGTILDVPIRLEVSEPSTPEFLFQVLGNRQKNCRLVLESTQMLRQDTKNDPNLFPAQVPMEQYLSLIERQFNAVLLDSSPDGIVVVYLQAGKELTPQETQYLILRKKVLLINELIPNFAMQKKFLQNHILPLLPEPPKSK